MRPATRISRRTAIARTVVAGAASEIILPNSTVSNSPAFTIVGGAGSVHASLNDASDSTYIEILAAGKICVMGLADLIDAGGRPIQSIDVLFRSMAGSYGSMPLVLPLSTGVTFFPVNWFPDGDESINDQVKNYVRNGGGTFTEAEINALTIKFDGSVSGFGRILRLRVRANY